MTAGIGQGIECVDEEESESDDDVIGVTLVGLDGAEWRLGE